jgi:hexosaminidase
MYLPKQTIMNLRFLLMTVIPLLLFASAVMAQQTALQNLIPKPVSTKATKDAFELKKETVIFIDGDSEDLKRTSEIFAERLRTATGFPLVIEKAKKKKSKGNIYFSLDAKNDQLGNEGYELTVSNDFVQLKANKPEGVFRGVQTLRQLLPPAIEMSTLQQGPWQLPGGTIVDYPTYSFRGSMLDVSRHFFSMDEVKQYIDYIAQYKFNILHLHLSDDQGWRIEIKSWPNLTQHGGKLEVGGGQGGYYTQEQYKELVKYAQDRYITIIPEIDMPGHTNAALASYPELNCDGKARDLYTGTEVGFSTLCTDKDVTYKFIDDVVRELAALTPGPYIHLGGDESHATKKEDYIPFVERVQEIAIKHGKQMIGWEEIAQAKLKPSTIVQYWSNAEHAKEAVKKGAKIIMSPATKVYLDMKYDKSTKLGLEWAARIEIDSSYNWTVSKRVKGITKENILGIEAPLWTETLTNMDEVEYLLFPRLLSVAELGWSPETGRSWDEYKNRLAKQAARFKAMKVDYYPSTQVPWESE